MSYTLSKVALYDGKGGPVKEHADGYGVKMTSTVAGRFVIASIGPHISQDRYADWSCLPWNTPMRLQNNIVQVNYHGGWMNLSKVNAKWAARPEASIKDFIEQENFAITKVKKVPDKWVFNDFGHTSVKYFKDLNGDYALNPPEKILGDFIHTTPDDEFLTLKHKPIELSGSHGCIHTKPEQLDQMLANGYIATGQIIEVHPYSEQTYELTLNREYGKGPYELHFYPGFLRGYYGGKKNDPALGQIVIYSVAQM